MPTNKDTNNEEIEKKVQEVPKEEIQEEKKREDIKIDFEEEPEPFERIDIKTNETPVGFVPPAAAALSILDYLMAADVLINFEYRI